MTAEETLRTIAEYDVKARHGYVDEWTEAEAFEAVQQLAREFFEQGEAADRRDTEVEAVARAIYPQYREGP